MITLFNKGAFVGEAIRSVLEQTFTDLELVVVNDASSDNGPDVVRSFTDERIRMVTNEVNLGRAGAANRGFKLASGEYVSILDADDIMRPERLAKQVAYMDAHPEVGACGSSVASFGADHTVYHWPSADEEARAISLFGIPVSYGASMLRSRVLREHGIQCRDAWSTPGMDYLFMLRVGRVARFANLPEVLIDYRIGEQNMRHGRDPLADDRLLIEAVFEELGFPISPEDVPYQLMLIGHRPGTWTRSQVRRLFNWCENLKRVNRNLALFPEGAFEREVNKRWEIMYYSIARSGLLPALLHLRYSKERSLSRMWHALLLSIK